MSEEIFVYVDRGHETILAGILWARHHRGHQSFSFRYDAQWLKHPMRFALDPHLPLSTNAYHSRDHLFGAMDDTTPDRWGRDLIRRAALRGTQKSPHRVLGEKEFLLGVNDEVRLGALRFKEEPSGPFLAPHGSIPPLERLGKLLEVVRRVDEGQETDADFAWLFAPGSSMGGARPKACLWDPSGHLLLAKFPRRQDTRPMILWEAVALTLAAKAGIRVSDWHHHRSRGDSILLLRRFDRKPADSPGGALKRVPFLSALNALGLRDGQHASYQDVASLIRQISIDVTTDLKELWRRLIFNILISNTDDHLRNHGFVYHDAADGSGWRLSPAYDLNPMPLTEQARELSLGVCGFDHRASLPLALTTTLSYGLKENEARDMAAFVAESTKSWRKVAEDNGISQRECNRMASAFEHEDLEWALKSHR